MSKTTKTLALTSKAKSRSVVQSSTTTRASTTVTKPATTEKQYDIPAAQNREIILKATAEFNLPMVPLVGNTFPVRRLLWTNGGSYDKATKTWSVPAQVHEEMQKAVNEVGAKVEAKIAASKAAKAANAANAAA